MRGKNTVDLITAGSVVELQDMREPFLYWTVRVLENTGGRLRLRHVGLEDDAHDTWLFYLDVRLRPMGWCHENHYTMEPPAGKAGPEPRAGVQACCMKPHKPSFWTLYLVSLQKLNEAKVK